MVENPTTLDNQRNEVNQMETILIIELITLYGIFIVGASFWVVSEIMGAIKKHKNEKAKNFNPLDKF